MTTTTEDYLYDEISSIENIEPWLASRDELKSTDRNNKLFMIRWDTDTFFFVAPAKNRVVRVLLRPMKTPIAGSRGKTTHAIVEDKNIAYSVNTLRNMVLEELTKPNTECEDEAIATKEQIKRLARRVRRG